MLATACAALAGCNIVAPAFLLISGPPKIKKSFTLPANKTTVLFIDDQSEQNVDRATLDGIAQTADELILAKTDVEDLISGRSALEAAVEENNNQQVPIAEIGRRVGAQVVIYARIDGYSIAPDGDGYSPSMRLNVRVLDLEQRKRVWPVEGDGVSVRVGTDTTKGLLTDTMASRAEARQVLASLAGTAIAQLFYTHLESESVRDPTPF